MNSIEKYLLTCILNTTKQALMTITIPEGVYTMEDKMSIVKTNPSKYRKVPKKMTDAVFILLNWNPFRIKSSNFRRNFTKYIETEIEDEE